MSQIEVERFLGRIITDAKFRDKTTGCLTTACNTNGFSLSAAEISSLQNIDYSQIDLIAETIDDAIRRT